MNGEENVAEAASHKEATPSKPEDIKENNTKTDIINSGPDVLQSNKFVLTPDYIQQSKYLFYSFFICNETIRLSSSFVMSWSSSHPIN